MLASLDSSDWIAIGAGVVALASFIVAVWSVTVAKNANDISEGSNTLAQESNEIARKALGHSAREVELAETAEQERRRQAQARAVMEAEVSPLFLYSEANTLNSRLLVRVKNTGDRDSGRTVVRVYVRAGERLMAWEDERTGPSPTRPVTDPEVKFYEPGGPEFDAQYLERIVDNITPTMHEEFRMVLPVQIPGPTEGALRLPIRVTVRAQHAGEVFTRTDYIQTEHGLPPA